MTVLSPIAITVRDCVTTTQDDLTAQHRAMAPDLPGRLAKWLQAEPGVDTGWAGGEQVDPETGAGALAAALIGSAGAARIEAALADGTLTWLAATFADLAKWTPEAAWSA